VRDEAEHRADSEAVEVGERRCRDAGGINVLAVIHGQNVRGGVFQDLVEEAGHRYDEWSPAWGTPPPLPLDGYDAVIVFGGSMHADQDDRHPWLREENTFIRSLLDRRVPLLGVCLGIQLIAKAAGAAVYPVPDGPEIGWLPVELTDDAGDDPVFGALPGGFDAFGWHYYTYDLPAGAEELARSARCNQAYRLGDAAWGIQFHAEVTLETVRSWLDEKEEFPLDLDRDELWAETQRRIGAWNELGRALCGAFVEAAERAAVPA
jgi:GMP synthase (glutamine-hydrolysing)